MQASDAQLIRHELNMDELIPDILRQGSPRIKLTFTSVSGLN